jgi:bifunctional DNA-binding transcriptional regulator/antitoxin component of YhaV-PrlF toxin-antitoxin module
MDITKLSSKGQVVIPEKMRKDYKVGESFSVYKVNEIIVLKPIKGLTPEEEKELKELGKIWAEIDKGKARKYSEKEFFDAMSKWHK